MKVKGIIGRLEKVDFPEFGIDQVQAKIDTGAYTSALHCSYIKQANTILHFVIQHQAGETQLEKEFTTTDFKRRKIMSSNGKSQLRYVIKTTIHIGGKIFKAEFSLTDRSRLKNPVLIGRKILKGKFLVDVSKTFLTLNSAK